MMVKRRPIRQLSLQQSATQRRPPFRRQQSEDDAGLRVTASSIRSSASTPVQAPAPPHSAGVSRPPRPIKLAWTDRRPPEQVAPSPSGVEVIARRLPGQPRPSPAASATSRPRNNLPSIDKDSILYTRQQLAERLRRAWKEREQSRPNLDIFLAHHNVEAAMEDSSTLPEPTPRDSPTPSSVSPSTLRLTISSPSSELSSEQDNLKKSSDTTSLCSTPSTARIEDSHAPQYSHTVHNFTPFPKSTTGDSVDALKSTGSQGITEGLTISIRTNTITLLDASQKISQEEPEDKKEKVAPESSIKKKETKFLTKNEESDMKATGHRDNTALSKDCKEQRQSESKTIAASVRRVNFRNSRTATISNSFCVDEPPPSPPPAAPIPVPPPRAVSAPPNRGILVNKDVKKEVGPGASSSFSDGPVSLLARNIRSAPANKRSLKPSVSQGTPVSGKGARTKSGVRGAGEESSGGEEGGGDKKRPAGRRGVPRGAEIVTMVSLLSDDDDEEDGAKSGADADRQAAPGLLQQAQQSATTTACWMEADTRLPAAPCTVPVPPRVVCLRKTPKSVTFQQPPASTWKVTQNPTTPAPRQVTPIITPASRRSSISALRPTSAPNGTKEKVSENVAPIETQTENHQLELDSSNEETQVADVTQKEAPLPPSPPSASLGPEPSSPGVGVMVARILKPAGQGQEFCARQQQEPEFETPKERECWQLYRKMLEKGVTVSYDTVLRGMLTPTEYRLRRGALLSSC